MRHNSAYPLTCHSISCRFSPVNDQSRSVPTPRREKLVAPFQCLVWGERVARASGMEKGWPATGIGRNCALSRDAAYPPLVFQQTYEGSFFLRTCCAKLSNSGIAFINR